MARDNDIQIVAGLDIPKSKSTIDKDIPVLEKELQNDKSSHPKLIATLDINKSKKSIQANLDTLISKTDAPKIKVGIDVGGVQETRSITTGLKDIQTQAKQTASNLLKLEDRFKNPISPILNSEGLIDAEKTISKIQSRFQELGKVSVKGIYSDREAVDNLDKMIASIKNGQNEARTLTFEFDKMGKAFYLTGGTSDNSGIAKNLTNINKTYSEYTQKFAQFKSTNHELLSGLTQPLTEFETKLNGLKTGVSTIEEVKSAYKSLQTASSNITQNFSRQLSPIDSAIRNISKGEETISGLKAEFKGLTNAPKEVNAELTKCASLLQNVKQIESEQGRTDVWSKAYREWIDLVDQLQAKLKTLRKEQINSASSEIFKTSDLKKADIPYMTKVSNTIEHQMAEIQKMSNAKGWQSFEVKGVEEANGKIKALTLTVRDAEGALKQLSMQRAKLDTGKSTRNGLIQVGDVKVLETSVKAQQKLNDEVAEYDSKIKNAIKSLNGFANNATFKNNSANSSVQMQKQAIQSLIAEYEHLKIQLQGNISPTGLKEIETHLSVLKSQFDTVQAETNELKANLASVASLKKFGQGVKLLEHRIIALRDANTKAEKQFGGDFDNLRGEADKLKATFNEGLVDSTGLINANRQLKVLEANIKSANKNGHTLFKTIGEQAKKFASWMSLTTIIAGLARSIRNMAREVIELDSAMTSLKKVTDETDVVYEKFLKNASTRAKELGVTITNLVDATSEFAKLGYSIDDAAILGEVASVYANVGELDIADATASLVSSMAAFEIEAKNATEVVDRFNAVGNQFSISSAGIGDALKRSASSLKASGNTIDESIAMITAANVVVQDPDVIGTALKTLSLRLTSTTAELEAMGEETEFACETLSDYRNLVLGLTKNEVDILGDDGQYKNTYNIIKEISKVWKDMDSMSRSSLMKSLFGVRQAHVGVSLIEQFDTAEKVLQTSINSQGSAMQEHSRWMQSAEAKINQFRTSFESLSQTIINSDFLKSLIDGGTSFLNVVENIIDKLDVLPLILGSISSGLAVKNVGLFQVINDKTSDGGQQIVTALKARKIAQMEATEQLNLDIDCLRKYEAVCKSGTVTADNFTETMQHASLSAQDYAEKIKNGTGSADAYVSSQQKIQSATKASTIATKALSVAMNALVVIATTKAISFVVEQIDKWIVTAEEAKEMSEDLVAEYNNALETANANAKSAKNLESRYKELSKGVGNFGENLSLTTEEYNEYNVLVNQIADMFPTLVQGYTDEGNAILSLKDNVEQLTNAYKEAQQEAYNLLIANGENSDGDSIITNWNKLHNTDFWGWITDLGAEDAGKGISKSDAIKQLEAIQNMSAERYREISHTVAVGSRKAISKLSEIEKDVAYGLYIPNALGIDMKVTDEEFAQAKKQARALAQTYDAEIQNALQDVKSLANAYFVTNNDYNKLDSLSKASVSKLVNSLDEQIASSFKNKNDVGIYVDSILQSFLSNDEAANALNKLFAMDTNNMPISETKQYVDKYINVIADVLGENADNLKIRLGFENIDDLEARYNAIISKFNVQEQNTISSFFTDNSINTIEELDYWQSVTGHIQTAQDAIEAYNAALKETVKENNKEVDFTTLKEGLEKPLSQIDKIKSAMQTLASGELLEWSDASELMFDIDTERVLGDFEEIDGEYRIIGNDIRSLIKLKDQLIRKQIDEIKLQKQSQEEELKKAQIKLATTKSQLSRSNSASDAKYWNKKISDIESQMREINSLIRDYNYLIGHLNSQLGDTVDYATVLKERMEKVQESADKYADAMTKQVDDIIDNLQDEQDILEEQKSTLEEQLDVLEEQKSELEDIIDKHKDIVDVIGEEVEREKKLLEEQRDAEEEAIQAKIDALKESKEKQEEENDLVEKELELQKKLADLEKAKQTKVRTFSQARGWHYDVDKEAVANAQTAVADAQKTYDDAVAEKVFSDQIEALEKQKETIGETYEKQLKAYENYYKEWKAILDEEINAENERITVEIMGSDWREKIKKRDSSILNSFASSFRSYNNQLKNLVSNEIANLKESIIAKEEEIKAKQKQIKVWQDYKDQVNKSIDDIENKYDDYVNYLNGVTLDENSTYEDRQNTLNDFVENYRASIDEIQSIQNSLSGLSTTIDVYVNTDLARNELANFLESYRDGVMGMVEMLEASSTGYGVVNSAGDAKFAEAANAVRERAGDINRAIADLRGYSTGGVNDNTGIVKLHGEKQRVETVFNAQQGRYLYDMVKTGNFSNLVAQKAIEGLKGAKMSNLTTNNSNDRIINIQNMTIKADNPTQFHDQFMKEIGQYWRVQLAESKVK